MALDFYDLNDNKHENLLFQFDGSELECLAIVLNEFNRNTGIYIDQYSDNKLSQDHVNLILQLISDKFILHKKKINNLLINKIIEKLKLSKNGLLTLGD